MVLKASVWVLLACMALPVLAQPAVPSTAQMVEQLSMPRTRSLRNLQVEAVATEVVAPAARPSLSLQIQFDFDSARVRPESQQALRNLAQALQSADLQESQFAIEGHTDAKGRADYNLQLSSQRAQAVRDYLKGQGITEARLVAQGKGATEPANRADPLAAENRRVRIVNLD